MPKITKQTMRSKSKPKPVRDAWEMATHMSILLYGESATGKTTLWATFPGPILAIVCSGGKNPGELRSIDTKEYRKKITAKTCDTADQVDDLIESAKSGEYQTVVLDNGTGLRQILLREEMGVEELPQQGRWGMATRDNYMDVASRIKEILFRFLSLPCNRVVIGHEKDHNKREDDVSVIAPDMQKPCIGADFSDSIIRWLNPSVDYIFQAFKRPRMVSKTIKLGTKTKTTTMRGRGVDYCIRCEPHDYIITKFRLPMGHVLPDVIVDPTYAKILAVINGEKVEK